MAVEANQHTNGPTQVRYPARYVERPPQNRGLSTGAKIWIAIAAVVVVGLMVSGVLQTTGYTKAAEITGIVWGSAATLGFAVWVIQHCDKMFGGRS